MNQIEMHGQNIFKIKSKQISDVLDNALSVFGRDNYIVELNFISKSEIEKLNKEHRRIDKPTDVLSFPQIDLPNVTTKILGNVVISPEVVAQKGETIDDVVKHGLLHLLGFDHETDEKNWNEAAEKIKCQY